MKMKSDTHDGRLVAFALEQLLLQGRETRSLSDDAVVEAWLDTLEPPKPVCCVCRVICTRDSRHWVEEGHRSRRFYFCPHDWANLVADGIGWYNGVPVFYAIYPRGEPR